MDVQALEERVREIEELLGLDVADATPTAKDFDIVPLKKRLQDLDLGFLLQIPKEKLTHLQEVVTRTNIVSVAEKARAVEFASGLLEKRADMLQQVERLSDVSLDSESITKVPTLMPAAERVHKDLKYIAEMVSKFDAEVQGFCEDLQNILRGLETRVAQLEQAVAAQRNT